MKLLNEFPQFTVTKHAFKSRVPKPFNESRNINFPKTVSKID